MICLSAEKFFRYLLHTSLFATMACSKQTLNENKKPTVIPNEGSIEASATGAHDSSPAAAEVGTPNFALLGPGVREVPMAAPGAVDNGTIAVINLFVKFNPTHVGRLERIGTGLYANGVVITAAHVIEELKRRIGIYNGRGWLTRSGFSLPKLPGFETRSFFTQFGVTPIRPNCYVPSADPLFWNDVGTLRFSQGAARLSVDQKLAELAGLPAGTVRNSPLNFSPQLTTGIVPRAVNYYGRKNNGVATPGKLWLSIEGSTIKSTACPMGGPCYFVFNRQFTDLTNTVPATLSEPGDSGGPLWMPNVGWIGLIVGKGRRPTNIYNVDIAGCSIGTVTFNPNEITTYFAKYSANSSFFRTVFGLQAQAGFWTDAVSGLIPEIFGFDLRSQVAFTNTVGTASVGGDSMSNVGIPEFD